MLHVDYTVVQRQKQMAHLEKELADAAVEDNQKLRLRLVCISTNMYVSLMVVFQMNLDQPLACDPEGVG